MPTCLCRRTLVAAVTAAVFAAGLFTGMDEPGRAAAAVERPLTIGMALEPPHLDPTAGAAAAIDEVLYANVFEGLTRINADGEVVPGLAAEWAVDPDGLTWTFTLRDGVQFHDGAPFDASVAKFALDRARAPGAENAQPQLFAAIDDVQATSPTVLTIRLLRPDARLPYALGWGDAAMVHPGSAEANKQTPVGTGPFRFTRWRRGDRVVLTRNDDYWGKAPSLPQIEFVFISDPTVALSAVLAGDVAAYPNFPAPEMLPAFADDPRFIVEIGTTEGEVIMAMNARRQPLDDIRVRQAIASGIDRQEVADGAMYGTATPIGSHYPPHAPGYVDLTSVNAFDPEHAKRLLAEAGQPDLSLELALPPPSYARRSGEIVAAQLREIGVEVTLRPVEWAEWLSEVFRGHDYDLSIVMHSEPQDIGIYGRPDYYFHVDDPELTQVLSELERENDPDARLSLLRTAQELIADDAVNAFLFQMPKIGVWDSRLEGLWRNTPTQANDVTGVFWRE